MKHKKICFGFRKIACLLFCFSMLLTTLVLVSCNTLEDSVQQKEQEESKAPFALALRATDDIAIGDTFSAAKLETVRMRADVLPDNAYSDISDLDGMYARSQICAGDIITAEKVSTLKPENTDKKEEIDIGEPNVPDPYELGYIVITEYLSLNEEDCSPAIQKAIEENPGRTIYFPDGKYIIKSPIRISTDPSKSVSLRLSNQAIITAAEWDNDKTEAMIQIGCKEEDGNTAISSSDVNNFDHLSQKSVSIIGGCLYGSKLASGIEISGGKDTYIYNVSIKQTFNGIHIKRADNELGATYVNVDNVNIAGMEGVGSAGILVEGTYNTFSNMRIASVNYGVLCTETGSDNVFRNIHPLVVALQHIYTVGFWDKSNGNVFDVCYSDQFSTGYLVEENTRSVFSGCFSFWYSGKNNYHIGYESTGQFNSIISAGKVYHRHSVSKEAYLYIGKEGGQGVVLYPINSINPHIDMLKQHCKTPIIVFQT